MRLCFCVLLVLSCLVAPVRAQERLSNVSITGHVVEPETMPVTDEAVGRLKVPNGFRVEKFADGLGKPRILAVAPDGSVYVTRREQGDVVLLRDSDGDGVAEAPVVVARRPQVHGAAATATHLYVVTVTDVYVAERRADGQLGPLRRIVDDLPHAGQHPNRTIAVGPDGQLYVSVGSTCNACDETSPEHATLLQIAPDGRSRVIYASGLRNTIGFDWHPVTGVLYGMDHGIDWLGDDDQPEELNEIVHGKQYGWPYIYADGKENPQDEPPGGIPPSTWARMSVAPVLTHTAHAAPMQMAFYDGTQFPAAYRHDAFVAMHGSWYRIAQEALNNVLKHAHAQRVDVVLETRAGQVNLIVADDGVGFDAADQQMAVGGFGILSMKERASLIGATLEIESLPGEGTTVYLRCAVRTPAD